MNATNFNPRRINNNVSENFEPVVLLGRCKKCRKGIRHTAQPGRADFTGHPWFNGTAKSAFLLDNGYIGQAHCLAHHEGLIYPCPCGGGNVKLLPVQGKFVAEKKCDGRCMGATGPNCDCSCGGKNHGCAHG